MHPLQVALVLLLVAVKRAIDVKPAIQIRCQMEPVPGVCYA